MLLTMLLAAATMPTAAITGDFDRDGRLDRIRLERRGENYDIMMYRSTGEVEPVKKNIPAMENFKFKKVSREARGDACRAAALSRYVCDAGDVIEFGNATDYTIAIWTGRWFVLHRPLEAQAVAKPAA